MANYPHYNVDMKTIQVTVEDELLEKLDKFLRGQVRGRSAFIRECVAERLMRETEKLLERQEEEGYRKNPIHKDEFVIDQEFLPWAQDDVSSRAQRRRRSA